MEVRVLGPPVIVVDGRQERVAGRQRALLGALAVAAPCAVSVDRLVYVVWGDQPPQDPTNALQQRISHLRRTIGAPRTGGPLEATGGGYALLVEPEEVDAKAFEADVLRGAQLLRDGDPAAARATLLAGLGRWAGDALEGVAEEPWAQHDVARLHELRLLAEERLAEAELALGGGQEVVARLSRIVQDNPLRERAVAMLVRALYRSGRQAAALTLCQRTRQLLADELGVDPGPELTRTYEALLRQDASVLGASDGLAVPVAAPNAAFAPVGTTALPAPPHVPYPLVGRETEVRRAVHLVGEHRLVTLTGPPGVGTTTTAAAAAHELAACGHQVAWAPLQGVPSGPGVISTVVRAAGVSGGGLQPAPTTPTALVAALRDRQLVLVLDGCEAVLDDVRALATELLNRCPGVRLLVTSRSVLDLPSERRQPVAPLGLPPPGVTRVADVLDAPAVRLLLERARARDPDFAVTQSTAPHAAAVVRRVDGLPLAVELAAARLTVLSLPELAAGLEDRLSLLVSRSRVEEPRRRSLRATLDWSWDLLDEEQRGAWCALAVPADDVDLTLAGALISAAGCRRPAVDLVQDLVERSLLTAVTSSSPTQYRMLGSLREYGAERLAQLQRSAAVHERYARWVDEQAVAAAGTWDPMCFDVDLDALERVLPHARQVLASAGDGAAGARAERIAGALGWLWFLRGMATEGLEWLDRYGPAGSPAAQCDPNAATWALGLKATGAGGVQHPPAPHSAEERGAPGPTEPARAVLDAVFAALTRAHRGDLTGADRDLDAAVTSASSVGGWPHGVALLLRAQLTRLTGGQPSTADLRHAVHLLTDARATWAHAYCLDLLVDDLVHQGKVATAMSLALEGLDLCRTERLPGLEVRMLVHLATLTHRRGETALSRSHTASALSLTASLGDPVSAGYTYLSAAAIAEERGDLAEAVHHLHDSLAAFGDAPAGAYGATQAREALTRITAMGHSALDRPSRLLT